MNFFSFLSLLTPLLINLLCAWEFENGPEELVVFFYFWHITQAWLHLEQSLRTGDRARDEEENNMIETFYSSSLVDPLNYPKAICNKVLYNLPR